MLCSHQLTGWGRMPGHTNLDLAGDKDTTRKRPAKLLRSYSTAEITPLHRYLHETPSVCFALLHWHGKLPVSVFYFALK